MMKGAFRIVRWNLPSGRMVDDDSPDMKNPGAFAPGLLLVRNGGAISL
jgi:hypothetical protein